MKTLNKFLFSIFYLSIIFLLTNCASSEDWRDASRASANIAPLPQETKDAIVHVYAAALWGIRGRFADHTWIATKKTGASSYKVYEAVGWNKDRGKNALSVLYDIPDRLWYGNQPKLLFKLEGKEAEPVVDRIEELAKRYPYKSEYTIFPGPNSNTFTAWMICQIPELDLKLSKRAIGKNYLEDCEFSKR